MSPVLCRLWSICIDMPNIGADQVDNIANYIKTALPNPIWASNHVTWWATRHVSLDYLFYINRPTIGFIGLVFHWPTLKSWYSITSLPWTWKKGDINVIYLRVKIVWVWSLCSTGVADIPGPRANFPVITPPVCRALLSGPESIEFNFCWGWSYPPSFPISGSNTDAIFCQIKLKGRKSCRRLRHILQSKQQRI